MSNFSQMMNDRSEARKIYNQRRKINQLELKNEKLQQEIKQFKEMWKDTNVIIKDNKKLMMNTNTYDYLEEKDNEIERLNNIISEYEKWLNDLGAWCYVEKLEELKESGNNE